MKETKITLITTYKEGTVVKKYEVEVWAERKSLTRSEFYSAYAAGLKPSFVLSLYTADYHLADKTVSGTTYEANRVRVNGRELNVIRTYEVNDDRMEMTVG